jgi:hypothetical protein
MHAACKHGCLLCNVGLLKWSIQRRSVWRDLLISTHFLHATPQCVMLHGPTSCVCVLQLLAAGHCAAAEALW